MRTELNTEFFFQAADAVEAAGENFDQSDWAHDCGTPLCVGGHVAFLTLEEGERLSNDGIIYKDGRHVCSIRERAREALGLTHSEAWCLFHQFPEFHWPSPWNERWRNAIGDTDEETGRLEAEVAAEFLRALGRDEASLPDYML